ncbi:hypothetical protein EXIGLDRAFT_766279 [Exidia glandulosa HHB12029]|uniref:Uncharacterized protein n=1 Tax=Exidia glandulosa HHB12029 TaxID=1314781 RepID=A0A165JUV8_EXIGL|nr:hypothetical protein EXIGLDRAFT_766279 [Exidia glandulosa HHB12029]
MLLPPSSSASSSHPLAANRQVLNSRNLSLQNRHAQNAASDYFNQHAQPPSVRQRPHAAQLDTFRTSSFLPSGPPAPPPAANTRASKSKNNQRTVAPPLTSIYVYIIPLPDCDGDGEFHLSDLDVDPTPLRSTARPYPPQSFVNLLSRLHQFGLEFSFNIDDKGTSEDFLSALAHAFHSAAATSELDVDRPTAPPLHGIKPEDLPFRFVRFSTRSSGRGVFETFEGSLQHYQYAYKPLQKAKAIVTTKPSNPLRYDSAKAAGFPYMFIAPLSKPIKSPLKNRIDWGDAGAGTIVVPDNTHPCFPLRVLLPFIRKLAEEDPPVDCLKTCYPTHPARELRTPSPAASAGWSVARRHHTPPSPSLPFSRRRRTDDSPFDDSEPATDFSPVDSLELESSLDPSRPSSVSVSGSTASITRFDRDESRMHFEEAPSRRSIPVTVAAGTARSTTSITSPSAAFNLRQPTPSSSSASASIGFDPYDLRDEDVIVYRGRQSSRRAADALHRPHATVTGSRSEATALSRTTSMTTAPPADPPSRTAFVFDPYDFQASDRVIDFRRLPSSRPAASALPAAPAPTTTARTEATDRPSRAVNLGRGQETIDLTQDDDDDLAVGGTPGYSEEILALARSFITRTTTSGRGHAWYQWKTAVKDEVGRETARWGREGHQQLYTFSDGSIYFKLAAPTVSCAAELLCRAARAINSATETSLAPLDFVRLSDLVVQGPFQGIEPSAASSIKFNCTNRPVAVYNDLTFFEVGKGVGPGPAIEVLQAAMEILTRPPWWEGCTGGKVLRPPPLVYAAYTQNVADFALIASMAFYHHGLFPESLSPVGFVALLYTAADTIESLDDFDGVSVVQEGLQDVKGWLDPGDMSKTKLQARLEMTREIVIRQSEYVQKLLHAAFIATHLLGIDPARPTEDSPQAEQPRLVDPAGYSIFRTHFHVINPLDVNFLHKEDMLAMIKAQWGSPIKSAVDVWDRIRVAFSTGFPHDRPNKESLQAAPREEVSFLFALYKWLGLGTDPESSVSVKRATSFLKYCTTLTAPTSSTVIKVHFKTEAKTESMKVATCATTLEVYHNTWSSTPYEAIDVEFTSVFLNDSADSYNRS